VTRTTRETSEAAGQMEDAAAELSRLGEQLRAQVDRFLREIRGQ
jgi:methyl-accepting chemotaxis protein